MNAAAAGLAPSESPHSPAASSISATTHGRVAGRPPRDDRRSRGRVGIAARRLRASGTSDGLSSDACDCVMHEFVAHTLEAAPETKWQGLACAARSTVLHIALCRPRYSCWQLDHSGKPHHAPRPAADGPLASHLHFPAIARVWRGPSSHGGQAGRCPDLPLRRLGQLADRAQDHPLLGPYSQLVSWKGC